VKGLVNAQSGLNELLNRTEKMSEAVGGLISFSTVNAHIFAL
jgi:hypothetical protein